MEFQKKKWENTRDDGTRSHTDHSLLRRLVYWSLIFILNLAVERMEVKRNFKELELNIGDPFCHIRLDGSRGDWFFIFLSFFSFCARNFPCSSPALLHSNTGLSVELTEAQTSEWEDLRGRLKVDDSITSSTIDDEIRRDIFTCKHCVLHHSDLVLSTKNTSDAAIGVRP